jgi:hypothetical protein
MSPPLSGIDRSENTNMKIIVLWVVSLLLVSQSAVAATASGSAALALTALVGVNSPLLSAYDKKALAGLLDGNPKAAQKKISVDAQSVVCRASNVDLTEHSCNLTFGGKTIMLKGRNAHELFATLNEAAVPSEGAAGSIFLSLSHLSCTIDPTELQDGGGADCKFEPGTS